MVIMIFIFFLFLKTRNSQKNKRKRLKRRTDEEVVLDKKTCQGEIAKTKVAQKQSSLFLENKFRQIK